MVPDKKLLILEAPTNLGLKTPDSGIVPGVDRLPDWFRMHGLHQRLASARVVRVAAPPYTGELDGRSGIRQAGAVAAYAQKVAKEVAAAVDQHVFPLVLGGDCSVLLSCCLGLPTATPWGLFFLDGHTDFAWPGLSPTGGAAGMDLALVTGYGPEKLTNLNGRKPYIAEADAWSVGNRDDDPAYVAAIESSAIQYWNLARLRREGTIACVHSFLRRVDDRPLAGFWIHLDVDVLADGLMPAVDSRQPGGMTYAELTELLTTLLDSGKAVGMDITILDPNLDASGQYVRQFIAELMPVWQRLAVADEVTQ